MFPKSLAAIVFGAATMGSSPLALAAPELVPHRAVYELSLADASERSGIEGMSGRMVYEFTGSACAGYRTNFRFVTSIESGDEVRRTDQQSTTFEDRKTGRFEFETKSFTNEQLDKQVEGSASEKDGAVSVSLRKPGERQLELAASEFPTEHMFQVIENARKGKRIFEARIFDGSDDGDQSLITTTLVGKPRKIGRDSMDGEAAAIGKFAQEEYWPVTIAYFNDAKESDGTPIYRMSFKLYDNGITRDLTLDYGDFRLTGKLTRLDVLETGPCNP